MKKLFLIILLLFPSINAEAAIYPIGFPQFGFTAPDTMASIDALLGCEDNRVYIDGATNIQYIVLNCATTTTYTQIYPIGIAQINGLSAALSGKQAVLTTGTSSQIILGDLTLGSLPQSQKVFFGTTQHNDAILFTKSAAVSSGTAVFQLTNSGAAGGTALFSTAKNDDSVNVYVSDSTASYQMSHAWSNSDKTLTVTCNKLTTANILTGILGQSACPNGTVIHLTVWGN